jgi:hypothetical protein
VKKLQGSVGRGGRNFRSDVTAVQNLLTDNGYAPGPADGMLHTATLLAIEKFQRTFMRSPDGLVQPGGMTWPRLIGCRNVTPGLLTEEMMIIGSDSSKWTVGKKFQSMHPQLRPKVYALLRALRDRGFEPVVHQAWRSVAAQAKKKADGSSEVPFSFHNNKNPDKTLSALAADVVDHRYAWTPAAEQHGYWDAIGKEAKKLGLFWGGDWKKPWDPAHVQLLPKEELGRIRRENGY